MRNGEILKYAVTALTILAFLYLTAIGTIQDRILGVVLLALVVWSLYPKRHLESSLLIIALIGLFEASLDVQEFINGLFSTYGGSGLWIILSGFVLAKGMEVSGLGKRIALMIATSMGCKPGNVILAVAVASMAIAPLSPSTTAKAFMILPICVGLAEAFGVEKGKSRFGAAIMLMAMAANNISSTAFLTATVPNPISAEYLATSAGVSLDWGGWFRMAFPITVLLLAASYLILTHMFKPEIGASKETYARVCGMRDGLGPLTRREKIVAITFGVALILRITERYNPLNAGLMSIPSTCIVVWSSLAPCTRMLTCSICCWPPTSGLLIRTPCARYPNDCVLRGVGSASSSSEESTVCLRTFCVSTSGLAPLTVIVSSIDPTCMSALMVAVNPAVSATPSRR